VCNRLQLLAALENRFVPLARFSRIVPQIKLLSKTALFKILLLLLFLLILIGTDSEIRASVFMYPPLARFSRIVPQIILLSKTALFKILHLLLF
jgi:hypothetical protein